MSLANKVFRGASEKFITTSDSILDRLNYELSVIEQLGLSYYFLNYKTIIDLCNKKGWLRTPGRGTAAASLVNYCLDITRLNPIEHGLYFERFLNIDHFKGINIDIDIPSGKRYLILELLPGLFPDNEIRQFLNPATVYPECPERYFIKGKEYVKNPTAVILTQKQPFDFELLEIGREYYWIENDSKEERKLIEPFRYDVLENDYLAFLSKISSKLIVREKPNKINLFDPATFNLLISGQTENIFLFSDAALKPILKAFKPASILEMAIISALYRPDLSDKIPKLIHHKFYGYKSAFPSDKRIEIILADTYGLLIFQESFLDIATQIAGLTATESEFYLRVLMTKKNTEKIEQFKEFFIRGCILHSTLNNIEIQLLTQMMIQEGPKTFQKSHSLSYSMVGYWGAYYKTHFRSVFDKTNLTESF